MIAACIVSCLNSNGEPDFFFVKVQCTQEQYDNGYHYEAAKDFAEDEGYEAYLVYDQNDPGGKAIMDKFNWQSASLITTTGQKIKCFKDEG